ncbi:MAG: LssY C-terminal domain-containing protein [Chromatiaceae bacterium]|nr:LssY C-terminal domain-containing protein [Chromatiaceae bacterium]
MATRRSPWPFYGFLAYLLIRSAKRWTVKVNLFFLAGSLILLIGLSRILLGVHYLSDVWAGYLVGALWLIVDISLSEWLTATGKVGWQAPVEPARCGVAAGLGAIALAGCAGLTLHWQPPRQVAAPLQTVELNKPINDYLIEQHLAYTETLLGEAEQPVGFVLVARNADTLLSSLTAAGWLTAIKIDLLNMTRLLRQGLDYTTAPLAPAFWNGQVNDLALETSVERAGAKSVATLRLWQTPYRIGKDMLFAGIAREHVGIHRGLLHQISPDVDAAADLLVQSLKQTGQVQRSCRAPLVKPMIGGYLLGGSFFTRGDLSLIDFTQGTERAPTCGTQDALP